MYSVCMYVYIQHTKVPHHTVLITAFLQDSVKEGEVAYKEGRKVRKRDFSDRKRW